MTIFPLYWSRKNANTTHKVILPFYTKYDYSYNSNSDTCYNKRRTYGLFLYHFKKQSNYNHQQTQTSKNGLFPIYYHKNSMFIKNGGDTSLSKHTVVFPFYWHYYDREKYSFKSKTVLFPLFWKMKDEQESITTFLPLFSYR